MTITAINSDNTTVFGNITYGSGTLDTYELIHLPVVQDIFTNDISGITPSYPPGYIGFPSVLWCFYFFGTEYLSKTGRFKSALPKYDLGSYNVAFRGSVTFEGTINYLAERSPVFRAWFSDAGTDYPSPYIAPSPVSDAYLLFLGAGAGYTNYGTDLYLQFTGLELNADVELVAYYQVGFTELPDDSPVSLGDI